jgi:hypothetical protein
MLGRAHCRDRRRTRHSVTGNWVCSVVEVSYVGTTIDSTSGATTLESLGVLTAACIAIEDVALATTVGAAALLAFRRAPRTPDSLFVPIGVILAN